jgi:hypothetical protein
MEMKGSTSLIRFLEFVQHTAIGETSHNKAAVELLWIQRFTLGPEVASSGCHITRVALEGVNRPSCTPRELEELCDE